MVARRWARYLVPVALVAVVAVGYVIVHHNLAEKSHPTMQANSRKHTTRPRGKYARARFYTVQAGDSLTSIAAKTGVDVNTLEALNPSANPNALQTGQQLRLRR
jgi:CBS-domain-containing membrane protein